MDNDDTATSDDVATSTKENGHRSLSRPASLEAADLPVVIEAERALEVVVSVAQEDKRK